MVSIVHRNKANGAQPNSPLEYSAVKSVTMLTEQGYVCMVMPVMATPHVDGVTPDDPLFGPPFTILTPGILRCLLEGGVLTMSEVSASRIDGSAVRACPLSSLIRSVFPEIFLVP